MAQANQDGSPKKKRKSRKKGDPIAAMPAFDPDGGQEIDINPEAEAGDPSVVVDSETGEVTISHDDGSITIDPTGDSLLEDREDIETEFDDNLADHIDFMAQDAIVEELLMGIESDKQDRRQWEQMRAKCVELLGAKLEEPKADVSTSALGMSTSVVRDPILLEAVEQFRANAYAELCPAEGPVKVQNFDTQAKPEPVQPGVAPGAPIPLIAQGLPGAPQLPPPMGASVNPLVSAPQAIDATLVDPENPGKWSDEDLAMALEDDLNYYLTSIAKEYYPDTRYMLWWTGLASGTFKKVYYCPRRRRPVSEYVDGKDLIVPSNATDLHNAGRITHESTMRKALMKRMQWLGVYREVDLSEPLPAQPDAVEQKVANIDGIQATAQRIEDQEYTIMECYCELDIKGFEHKDEDGKITGLPLPFKVTIEEGSRKVLEVRRNWEEDDPDQVAKIPFVLFPFSTGLSRIYGSGLGQMGGNIAAALTAMMRITIDAGMMSTYPGLLKAKGSGRQLVNEIRVPPGGCAEIDTGGLPIQSAVMGMPYKDMSAIMVQFMSNMREIGQRLLGSANIPVGEGTADVPVGTILAQIEQATKIEAAVHKALHAAQDEEFQLLCELFKKDPESLWRGKGNRKPALGTDPKERLEKFKAALANCLIRPRSDPNVPSQTHRMLLATWLGQLAAPGGVPDPSFDQIAVKRRQAEIFHVGDFDSLLNKNPQVNQPDPIALAALQIKGKEADAKVQQVQVNAAKVASQHQIDQAKLQSGQETDALKIAHQHIAATQPQQPDPLQARALQLKQQQVNQTGQKMLLDSHNQEQDRLSQQSVKALDVSARLATHPESQPIVNSELGALSPFLTPSKSGTSGQPGGMAEGGSVDGIEPSNLSPEEVHQLSLALQIAEFLSNQRTLGTA